MFIIYVYIFIVGLNLAYIRKKDIFKDNENKDLEFQGHGDYVSLHFK